MQNSYSNDTAGCEYAGFWVRFAAYLLDSVIVFFALFAVRLAVSGIMAAVKGTLLGGNLLFQYDLKDIVLYLSEALYFILCTYYTGTTLGKKAMNLRVISAGGEEKPGLLTIVYRETVGRFLSGVIMGVGYLMIGIDKEKRGIHDILCDTRVIYGKKIKVFKMETAFTPLAEPMGRVPEQERMPREDPKMPWDAPYIRPQDAHEPNMQATSAAPEDVQESKVQTPRENDTDTTTERDS